MRWLLILGLILAVVVTVFTLINKELVDVSFLFFSIKIPLVLVMILMLLTGAILGLLAAIPSGYKKNREIKRLKARVKALESASKPESEVVNLPQSLLK